nr:hypothetical protein [Tanacetum cinerariifolium]
MTEAVREAVQIRTDRLHDSYQKENDEFLRTIDDNMKRIIKEQVKSQVKEQVSRILPRIEEFMNAQLEAEVLTRSSHSSRTSYAVATDLSEMELKKILIEKMEGNKSIQRSDEQRNPYKALVDAYEADKIILDSYGETAILKRRREDDDDQEGPSASASESAFAEEPVQTISQIEEPSHPKPLTPDRDWNKTLPAVQGSAQTWISELAKQADSRSSFNELLDTPIDFSNFIMIDFSNFIMNRLGVDALTPELLAGPTYELKRGSCNSLTELEYHLEEVYKPLPLIPNNRGRRVIPFAHFINNDLEYLQGGVSSRKYTTSVTKTKSADYGHIKWIEDLVPRTMWIQEPINYDKHALWGVSHWGRKRQQFYWFAVNRESALDVYSKRRIIAVTDLKIVEWHIYKHLDWISVRRDDDKIYNFKEGDFKRLRLQDIEDMLLLFVQGNLSNLTVEERFDFNVSLRMFTRSIVIQRRVEDLQLGVKSYQKRLNLTKPDTYRSDLKRREAYTAYSNPRGFIYQNKDKKKRLMRIDKLHKFSDWMLNDVRNALDDRLKEIRMQYLPQTIWRKGDKDRAAAMIQAIDKMLKTRRIMRSLERFVGGRLSQLVIKEVEEWVKAGIVRPVRYPKWISNPVRVKKGDRSWMMCVDFKNLNSACPKDYYPHSDIDGKIESVVDQGTYCYTKIPFELKSARATYQMLVDTDFQLQIGRNLEAYVDDMDIKSNDEKVLIADVAETFDKHRYNEKNKDEYRWTKDAKKAFQEMKKVIVELPLLTTPTKEETLYVYLASAEEAVSAILLRERNGKQCLIHYVSGTLNEVEKIYASLGKLALSLLHMSRRLRRYFKAHPIKFIMNQPFKQLLNKAQASRKLPKYSVELGTYNITYEPRNVIKDRASNNKVSGAGLVLISPNGTEFTYALRLNFTRTNNKAEYEALLVGLCIAAKIKLRVINVKLATHAFDNLTKEGLLKLSAERSTDQKEVGAIMEEEEDNWMTPIIRCLTEGIWPKDKDEREIHMGSCGMHIEASLTYGSEAMIPVEIGMPTHKTMMTREDENEEELRLNMDLLQERREAVTLREAKYKTKMELYYNQKVRDDSKCQRPRDEKYSPKRKTLGRSPSAEGQETKNAPQTPVPLGQAQTTLSKGLGDHSCGSIEPEQQGGKVDHHVTAGFHVIKTGTSCQVLIRNKENRRRHVAPERSAYDKTNRSIKYKSERRIYKREGVERLGENEPAPSPAEFQLKKGMTAGSSRGGANHAT